MFVLATVSDVISTSAEAQRKSPYEAVVDGVHARYANRVLPGVGLCLCVHDVLECGVGKVRWGDGKLYYRATFRLVVFHPSVGEIMIGKILSATEDGIRVTLGFFDDIFIPSSYIPTPRAFDHAEQTWFWAPGAAADEPKEPLGTGLDSAFLGGEDYATDALSVPKEERAYLDVGEIIRFRVEAEEFLEDQPDPKRGPGVRAGANGTSVESDGDRQQAPYVITVSVSPSDSQGPVPLSGSR